MRKPIHLSESRRAALVLLVALSAVYAQALSYPFVWDDVLVHLHHNPHFQPFSMAQLLAIWSQPYEGLYVPVAYTLWGSLSLLSEAVTGSRFSLELFHGTNLLLHWINAQLVYWVLRRLNLSAFAALSGALLFLLHPLQVESVVWVSELRGLLAASFGLLGLQCYLLSKEEREGATLFYALGMASFSLGLLSKPSVAVLPLMLLALEWWFRTPIWTALRRLLPWLILPGLILGLTFYLQVLDVKGEELPTIAVWQRPLLIGATLAFYTGKLLVPVHLSPAYGLTPVVLLGKSWVWGSGIIGAALLYGVARFGRQRPLFLLGVFWFLLGFVPVSGVADFSFMLWSSVADRYAYPAMVGAALMFAVAVERFSPGIRASVLMLLTPLAVISGVVQVPIWQHPLTLWNQAIQLNSANPKAYNNRSNAYLIIDDWDSAARDLATSRRLPSAGNTAAYPTTASYARLLEMLDESAARETPGSLQIRAYLAYRLGNQAEALECLDKSFHLAAVEGRDLISGSETGYLELGPEKGIRFLVDFARQRWGADWSIR